MRLTRALLRPLPLLALSCLAACGAPEHDAAGSGPANAAVNGMSNATANVSNETIIGTPPSPSPAPAPASFDSLGKIRIGATLKALERDGLAIAGRDEPLDEESTCTYATFKGLPDVAVMLDGEKVARIDVGGAQHETLGGVRVGQSEADALKRLGNRAKVEAHPYTGPEGHYLVVHEDGAPHGLIVETDGKAVQSWRIGQWEQVQWIEGCA